MKLDLSALIWDAFDWHISTFTHELAERQREDGLFYIEGPFKLRVEPTTEGVQDQIVEAIQTALVDANLAYVEEVEAS